MDDDDAWGMDDDNAVEKPEVIALKEFPKDEVGGGECQKVLQDWFGCLRERAGDDDDQYQREIWEAVEVLSDIRSALNNYEKDIFHAQQEADQPAPVSFRLWAWPGENTLAEPPSNWRGNSPANVVDLDYALVGYLKRPWLQIDTIDTSVINALLFSELAEYVEGVKTGALFGWPNFSYILSGGNIFAQFGLALAGRVIGFLAAWVIMPAVAAGLLAYGYETGAAFAIGLWGLYVLYRVILIPAQWRARKARRKMAEGADEVINAMMKAWVAARGSTVNPSRLKELVVAAEERGAIFRPVLHTVIDRAIQRDPTALMN